ncbi:MAG: peptidylprolyl isomerase [Cyanobacteriota bacterium]|nr:peptidylprolyl isomerase [Cyanobacteriota bacterium]MDY7012285.1 peptidylprolyl isomerase [Cyanobacteriota bacterium]
MQETLKPFVFPEVKPATDEEILAYLRQSHQLTEIAVAAEENASILAVCEQFGIAVSDEELQVAGDTFRQENRLLGTSETLAWLAQQRISVEDWSQGVRISLLRQKLKEHLFGEAVDNHYIGDRDLYKRVALSQILVRDLTAAMKIVHALREGTASFCALALEQSKGKQSKENGGFVGVRFLAELLPEIAEAVSKAAEGEVIEPVQTKLGYHILRVEKWFPAELGEVREQVLESLFQGWLKGNGAENNPEINFTADL